MGCKVLSDDRQGWRAVVLENELLRAVLLPEKGADLYELVDLRSGIDVLFKTPWGLQPPGSPPREGSGDDAFLWNYEGGWQELFPSAGDACSYEGVTVPFHGEVATLPWTEEGALDTADEARIELGVRCRGAPFSLSRSMSVSAGAPTLRITERVRHEGDHPAPFVWGHHCVLGPPFIAAGCRLEVPAKWVSTLPESFEETARLKPGQHSDWPTAESTSDETLDLSEVPGPETASHDDVYLSGLSEGRITVRNPRLGLTFTMRFDHELFKWVVAWQPYGGARAMPLVGSYGLGVEPWTSNLNLEQAFQAGEAIVLDPGAFLETQLSVTIDHDAP